MHVFFFNDTATTEIYTLSLHDALPISSTTSTSRTASSAARRPAGSRAWWKGSQPPTGRTSCGSSAAPRSEEHTSELQSRQYLVCRLLLEKKKNKQIRKRYSLERNNVCM